MKCENAERGCQWTGTVGTSDDHTASCQYNLVPCPNNCNEDNGDGQFLLIWKDMEGHLKTECMKRAYKCLHCGEEGTFASIMEDHDKVCTKKPVACPNKNNGCTLSMEKMKMEEHVISDCGYTEIACVYESLGCGVRMLRKDKTAHEKEDREKHMKLSLATVTSLSEQLQTLTERHEKESKQHEDDHKKLSEIVRLQDEQLKLLIDQNKTLSGEAVVFKVPAYASKKIKNYIFFSPPFYTHPGGYKMRVLVVANGHGEAKGTHMSVFVELLQGQYDSQLHWPFLGDITYELLNQLRDFYHHKVVSTFASRHDMKVGSSSGPNMFLPHSSLGHNPDTNTLYLLNDTLYIRLSVNVTTHKPWLDCTHYSNFLQHKAD